MNDHRSWGGTDRTTYNQWDRRPSQLADVLGRPQVVKLVNAAYSIADFNQTDRNIGKNGFKIIFQTS
jgi:hypothetical protein